MPQAVIAFVTDLIFQTSISGTARAVGADLRVVGNIEKLQQGLVDAPSAIVLLDLNAAGDPLAALRAIRGRQNPPRTICYLSHVQKELADAARQAGADEVLARSEFVARLPELLAAPREE